MRDHNRPLLVLSATMLGLGLGLTGGLRTIPGAIPTVRRCYVAEPTRDAEQRLAAAQAKRDRREDRNRRNEEAQGRYPETAWCSCGEQGEINYDDGTSRRYYCYGSERCCP